MMKKGLAVLAVLMICVLSVFAGKALSLDLRPYELQVISNGESKVSSSYGFGLSAGFETSKANSWSLGVSADVDDYFIKGSNLLDLSLAGVFSYRYSFREAHDLVCHAKYGMLVQISEGKTSLNQILGVQIGVEKKINDKIKASVCLDNSFSAPKKESTQFFNWKMSLNAGIDYML